jgi:superfamily II DNA or RNA helicase
MLRDKLWDHNRRALEYVEETFKTTDSTIVVQPTGSGKSGVMFGYIEGIFSTARNIIVIQPSLSIEHAQKASSLWNKKWDSKVRYITYSKMSKLRTMLMDAITKQGFTDVDLVVLDEVHHIAAPVWRLGFDRLKELNPQCKFLGLTATPIRYLDDGLNVADEYFNGNVIESITLIEAIKKEVFAKPRYVTAYFGKDEILRDMQSRINSFPSSGDYRSTLMSIFNKLKSDWDTQSDIDEKIEKYINLYLSGDTNIKFVVFMSSISELLEHRETVENWFKKRKIRNKVNSYDMYSGNGKDDEVVLKSFSRSRKDSVDLLFAVDKLNEGVHIKGLSGVIMLRDTTSPTVYYQQLGRCFSAGMDKSPLIFDFVNNHSSLGVVRSTLIDESDATSPISGTITVKGKEVPYRGLEYSTVTMHDEMMDLSVLLDKLDVKLVKNSTIWFDNSDSAWLECFSELSSFITSNRRLPSSADDFTLFSWFRQQVACILAGLLDEWKKQKLINIGVRLE